VKLSGLTILSLPLDSTLNYFIFILILTSTLSLPYGRNLRIRLPTERPYSKDKRIT